MSEKQSIPTEDELLDPLSAFIWKAKGSVTQSFIHGKIARYIQEHPQALLDALVDAKVLHTHRMSRGTKQAARTYYTTNPAIYPHTHEWQVLSVRPAPLEELEDDETGEPRRWVTDRCVSDGPCPDRKRTRIVYAEAIKVSDD